ncbi:hypothetical protein [uncultured Methanobrevibacter sp.]|uniref:hypothetical protein n=1 Tax=uncultured Methanobrevibacter sp. TaxID=253161 RepID=UPI00262C0703|nr:hypothetical protein [uncultured Methanobrevibacter sp.]
MNEKGSISSEILIVLIVILLIIGITAKFSETTLEKIAVSTENENIELLLSQSADNLVNNLGSANWEKYLVGTPGLAISNENEAIIPNSVSYDKFLVLGDNYKKLVDKNIFNSKIKTSMEIIPKESSISSVKIGSAEDTNNIYSVNRLVKCDFYKKYVIKDFQTKGKCNHDHGDDYSCNYFKIYRSYLKNNDYYLLIDDNSTDNLKWYMDNTKIKSFIGKNVNSDKIYLNHEINLKFPVIDFSSIMFIHFNKKDVKALLVSVPKDFDKSKLDYDYFRTNNCEFILKGWY